MTEQPWLWLYSAIGIFRPALLQPDAGRKQCRPSMIRQPKSTPLPRLVLLLDTMARSISSYLSWPTSPIHRSPVARSNDQPHGLRRPRDQISFAPNLPTYGFDFGMRYWRAPRW